MGILSYLRIAAIVAVLAAIGGLFLHDRWEVQKNSALQDKIGAFTEDLATAKDVNDNNKVEIAKLKQDVANRDVAEAEREKERLSLMDEVSSLKAEAHSVPETHSCIASPAIHGALVRLRSHAGTNGADQNPGPHPSPHHACLDVRTEARL